MIKLSHKNIIYEQCDFVLAMLNEIDNGLYVRRCYHQLRYNPCKLITSRGAIRILKMGN